MQRVERDAGERFRAIGLASIADDDPPPFEHLREHVQRSTAWVAESGGAVVGYAVASIVDGSAHLDQVSVTTEASGRGIGRALVEDVCAWAVRNGSGAITLTTFRDVAWNGPWYRRLGFDDLTDDALGPELGAIRRAERDAGIDVAPRVAMRRDLSAAFRDTRRARTR